MPRDPRDPQGHYAALNLSPGASDAEIRLAYTFLKNAWRSNRKIDRARVKEAYDVLIDPESRREYRSGRRGGRGGGARLSVDPMPMLGGGLAVVLLLVAGFFFPGFLLPDPEPFAGGQRLLNSGDLRPLGEIIRKEEGHVFPNGSQGDAYLVRLEEGGERWFPASDLERHYRAR